MKNRMVISAMLTGVIVGVTLIFILFAPKVSMPAANDQTASESTSPSPSVPATPDTDNDKKAVAKGAYVPYSADKVSSTLGTKVLFFHAAWCPQCRALDGDIMEKGVPDGVTIFKVDYDTNTELRQKYGVTLQTTLVTVDNDGELVKKYVAYNEPTLESVKQNLLQ